MLCMVRRLFGDRHAAHRILQCRRVGSGCRAFVPRLVAMRVVMGNVGVVRMRIGRHAAVRVAVMAGVRLRDFMSMVLCVPVG